MQFIKKIFNHDKTVIGLTGLRKQAEYVKIAIPESYKKTFVQNTEQNFLLI